MVLAAWRDMPRRSWMLARLDDETRAHHGIADGHRLAMLELIDEPGYAAALARIAGFERPVEAAIAVSAEVAVDSHLRSDLLAHDLEALGVAPGVTLPIPKLAGSPEALGWLYVLHRHTLLHGLIERQLGSIARARSYLAAFSGTAGARTYQLGILLEHTARRTLIADRIVLAAHDAFRAQRQWYTHAVRERRLTPRVQGSQARCDAAA